MVMEPSPTRRAKEAYVVADALKGGLFHSREAFLTSLENLERDVALWSDSEIDVFITSRNPPRLDFYNRAKWRLDGIPLDKCIVWRSMGERAWAEGSVTTVAELFTRHEPKDSRIWDMQKFSDVFSSRLPIIVFPVGPSLMIDDGSHRAVAMALEGLTSASAWIGLL
jgi:hypothetical protein